jgi:hypothetical protein
MKATSAGVKGQRLQLMTKSPSFQDLQKNKKGMSWRGVKRIKEHEVWSQWLLAPNLYSMLKMQ